MQIEIKGYMLEDEKLVEGVMPVLSAEKNEYFGFTKEVTVIVKE